MLRYLRITASVTSLIACMLLIALWVRSYWHKDILTRIGDNNSFTMYSSFRGGVRVEDGSDRQSNELLGFGWILNLRTEATSTPEILHSMERFSQDKYFLPYWMPVLFTGILAAILGIRRPFQFSLRTLLLATTIIAVWLGLIGWLI